MPCICDYEGSRYRQEFWGGGDRSYEDLAERIALRALLPPQGDTLLEVGAGYGRLADLYQGYRQVVLMDYARSQLEEAIDFLDIPPEDERFTLVVADIYHLPFVDNLFDALTMVRVMHHLADVPAALAEMTRVLNGQGVAVVEFASKRHLKAIARWLLRRQPWTPFAEAPLEFAELNFDFHPAWMRRQFHAAGLAIERTRTVSHFRHKLLKRLIPPPTLAALDGLAQRTGDNWQLTPSVFLRARALKPISLPLGFFRCPACGAADFEAGTGALICRQCTRTWSREGGIWDFRNPA